MIKDNKEEVINNEHEIIKLKEGEYIIHILIEKAKNFKLCEFKEN